MHHEQDVKYMGGLKKYMPITYWTFLLASLSISGVPGLAGFFSKDEILAMAYVSHVGAGKFAWFIGTLVAGITAFYSFRLFFLIFHGEFRGTQKQKDHLHESPKVVTIPLMLLAVGAVAAGWFGIPAVLGGHANWGHFLEPVVGHPHNHPSHATEIYLMILSVGAGAIGIFLAWLLYLKYPKVPQSIRDSFPKLYSLSLNKYFIDEIYVFTIIKPVLILGKYVILLFFDQAVIDGIFVTGFPKFIGFVSGTVRKVQNGLVSHYLAYMGTGIVLIIIWMYVRA
jgi:NADH-quinone oxidoreductase subunit L